MRARPFLLRYFLLGGGERFHERAEISEIVANQNQAFFLRTTLDPQQLLHRPFIARITADAEARRGGISDQAAFRDMGAQVSPSRRL